MANAGRHDLDQHFAVSGTLEVELDDLERLLGGEGDGGTGFHGLGSKIFAALPPRKPSANAESHEVAMQSNNWLEGRHALITGGGTGIGASAATHLHAAGARVSLLGRRLEPLERTAAIVAGTVHQCDVTNRAAIEQSFGAAREANGPIELLVVNAGIAESAPFHKMTRDSWDRIIATNLTAAFDCAQAAIADLLASDNGRLVFIASVASLRGVPYAAHYAASKHGLLGLMRSLAAEYAKSNLTVNAVCPGYVDTPMTDQSVARVSEITGRSEEQARGAITNMNASGRLVDPDGIGTMILTLCLPQSRDINGAAVTIDGGTSA
jgi:NAD(P)-dependent dehydrogenase (short-subunit alcohol dehydrogenase family)